MATQYDEGPELAPQHQYPEVYHPPPQPSYSASPQPIPVTPMKREDSTYGYPASGVDQSVYGGTQYQAAAGETAAPQKSRKTICGCTFLVFLLSVIIAVLAAAVIGLAAGTGVEASRANNAIQELAAMSASATSGGSAATTTVTVTSASATATGFAALTNGCSNSDETTTGQTYTTDFFGKKTFTMYCNFNAPNPPLMSLFTANFNNCMDACAAFTNYEPGFEGNATCTGVSFIPLWTTRSGAVEGNAPGNCYLKPGKQTKAGLETPNIGTECHAAIMD
ncbi:hypothetical protein CORC01_09019 [Colletotrichum orchidophilum]|uniref:Apple domain-containing protein n=1 Tax=Colletotrichum orchidophilum TaxID=1209926 RepID=A0A1G4B340_9PEZI|nr:uncharacterized protein CORC01_09019 [Colletotrichum orchidophilum]OHE95735.1 hypothetical protein CORC01_09019 [Colletotrichum orchidophilum]